MVEYLFQKTVATTPVAEKEIREAVRAAYTSTTDQQPTQQVADARSASEQ
jgi:hypothetical protein